ncbi:hypothetical protein OPQ81_002973 [Rhizoctonia solani]|nr:hypothetical protein OPQ81_002973 [Rhizoctonia solani]
MLPPLLLLHLRLVQPAYPPSPLRAIFAKVVGGGRWGVFVIKRDANSKGKQRAAEPPAQPLTAEALASLSKGKGKGKEPEQVPPVETPQVQSQPVDEGAFLVIYDLDEVFRGSADDPERGIVAEHVLKTTPSTMACRTTKRGLVIVLIKSTTTGPGAGTSWTNILRWDYSASELKGLGMHKAACMLGATSIAELELESDQPPRTLVAIVHRPRTVMIQDVDSGQRCFVKVGKVPPIGSRNAIQTIHLIPGPRLLALRSVQAEQAMYTLEEYQVPPMGETSQPTVPLQRQWIRSPDLQICTIVEGPTYDDGSLPDLALWTFETVPHRAVTHWLLRPASTSDESSTDVDLGHETPNSSSVESDLYTPGTAPYVFPAQKICTSKLSFPHHKVTLAPGARRGMWFERPERSRSGQARGMRGVWGYTAIQAENPMVRSCTSELPEDVLGAMENNTLGVAFDELSGRMIAVTCGDGYSALTGNPRDAEVPDMPDLRDLRRIAQGGAPARTFYDEDEDDVGVAVGAGEEPRVDVLDVRDLEQEEFDPDAYLRSKLASSTEAELRAFQASLQTTKDATALDLQKNVFKNYSDFVVISKEISTLENDMLELKASLQEWKNMPNLLAIDPSTSNITGESANVTDTRRRTARSSIADLRTLYISQLQTLHSTIEGSATLVPTIPGRHIIAEASDLQQLNAATYRPEHGAHIVLLDDSLLVARRRRGRLVADRAWQLGEISLVDVRDTSELQNVFKIKRGQDTFVYKTERVSDKRAILSQFRKAAEELAARKRKEREGEHEKRRSLWVAGDRKSLALDAMPALPAWMAEMAAGSAGAAAKAEQDEKWINNFIDELTVAVALRDWDSAVNLVVKGQGRTAMVPGLSSKLNPLAEQLTAELLGALADPGQRRSSTIKVVAYIVRLGPDALVRARDTFLNARASLMRKRVRAIRFEGDVRSYIKELALIVFTSVKHTADWYLASFKDFEMASGLIRWAKEQVEDFAKMFCIQVYGSETNEYDQAQALDDTAIAQECIQIAKNQNRRLLRDIGMDFSFVLLDLISIPTPPSETTKPVVPEISIPDTPTESVTNRPPRPPRSPAPPPPRSRDREREGSTGRR